MGKLDDVIVAVNGDLRDCLTPVMSRFRSAVSAVVDYAIANPAQGNPSIASAAIAAAFRATYADGLVSPGITIETMTTAFVNRHGVGATMALKWAAVRDWIVARAAFRAKVLEWVEEGSIGSVPELKLITLMADPSTPRSFPSDRVKAVYKTVKGFPYRHEWSSVSLGYGVRVDLGYTTDANGDHRRDGTRTVTEF